MSIENISWTSVLIILGTIIDKGRAIALDDDGEELTPHGSVENLFISSDVNLGTVTNDEPNIVPNYNLDNTLQHCKETVNPNTLYKSNVSKIPINAPTTQLRRSTSMSCSSQGNGMSTKTVSFTLPVTETKSVRL